MSEKTKATIELTFADGAPLRAWESVRINESYTDYLGSYSFTIRPPRQLIADYEKRLRKGDLVGIKINGNDQATVLITTREITVGQGGVTFKLDCRSVLATLAEGSVDPKIHQALKSETSVAAIVKKVTAAFGFGDLRTDLITDIQQKTGSTKPVLKFKDVSFKRPDGFTVVKFPTLVLNQAKDKDLQAQHGESAYQFLSRILGKHGVALHVAATGELLLTKPNYDQEPTYKLVQDNDFTHRGDRMIDDIALVDTNDGVFSEVVVEGASSDKAGEKRANKPLFRVTVEGRTERPGTPYAKAPTATVPEGRHHYLSETGSPYKPRFVHTKNATTQEQCKKLAHLLMGGTSYKGFHLDCTVDGLVSVDGAVWCPNTVAHVVVQALGFDEPLWILERSMTADRSGGQKTNLTLIPLNSLMLEEPQL